MDKTKDLHRDKQRHLERKKNYKQNSKVRTHLWDEKTILGTIDQNMIDDENAKKQKTFKVIGGDILREKKNTNKRLR